VFSGWQYGGGGWHAGGAQSSPGCIWKQAPPLMSPAGQTPASFAGSHTGATPPQHGWTQTFPLAHVVSPHGHGPLLSGCASAAPSVPPSPKSMVTPPHPINDANPTMMTMVFMELL
jgi:hypothetical protein